jgi:hypothetical protein
MNLRSSTNKSQSSPSRIEQLKEEDALINDIQDKFPNLNSEKESNVEYSYIPKWLNEISENYICNALAIMERKTLLTYKVIKNHRVCKSISTCNEPCKDFSDELIESRFF